MTLKNLNYKSGFFRVWVVLSALWVCYAVISYEYDFSYKYNYEFNRSSLETREIAGIHCSGAIEYMNFMGGDASTYKTSDNVDKYFSSIKEKRKFEVDELKLSLQKDEAEAKRRKSEADSVWIEGCVNDFKASEPEPITKWLLFVFGPPTMGVAMVLLAASALLKTGKWICAGFVKKG